MGQTRRAATTKVVKTISHVPLTIEEWAAKYGAEVINPT
jgi:hypothetical protein